MAKRAADPVDASMQEPQQLRPAAGAPQALPDELSELGVPQQKYYKDLSVVITAALKRRTQYYTSHKKTFKQLSKLKEYRDKDIIPEGIKTTPLQPPDSSLSSDSNLKEIEEFHKQENKNRLEFLIKTAEAHCTLVKEKHAGIKNEFIKTLSDRRAELFPDVDLDQVILKLHADFDSALAKAEAEETIREAKRKQEAEKKKKQQNQIREEAEQLLLQEKNETTRVICERVCKEMLKPLEKSVADILKSNAEILKELQGIRKQGNGRGGKTNPPSTPTPTLAAPNAPTVQNQGANGNKKSNEKKKKK
jgi:hypothetical protein